MDNEVEQFALRNAERLAAQPVSDEYASLSVLVSRALLAERARRREFEAKAWRRGRSAAVNSHPSWWNHLDNPYEES